MQTVTTRPLRSNAMVPPQSPIGASGYDPEVIVMEPPSGPAHVYVSVMYPSLWMLLLPFGAMYGCRGTFGALTRRFFARLPVNSATPAAPGLTIGAGGAAGAWAAKYIVATVAAARPLSFILMPRKLFGRAP
jgi:hypothetical protein